MLAVCLALLAFLALVARGCAQQLGAPLQALINDIHGCLGSACFNPLHQPGTPGGAAVQRPWTSPAPAPGGAGSYPSQSASRVFAVALAESFEDLILLSWGFDRAAENARRLEWMAQSIREHVRVHGQPPADLAELRISRDDLLDVFGTPIEYRVVGSPPEWEIRSAGRDRVFDGGDPWLIGP
jgi:hypothetical protein